MYVLGLRASRQFEIRVEDVIVLVHHDNVLAARNDGAQQGPPPFLFFVLIFAVPVENALYFQFHLPQQPRDGADQAADLVVPGRKAEVETLERDIIHAVLQRLHGGDDVMMKKEVKRQTQQEQYAYGPENVLAHGRTDQNVGRRLGHQHVHDTDDLAANGKRDGDLVKRFFRDLPHLRFLREISLADGVGRGRDVLLELVPGLADKAGFPVPANHASAAEVEDRDDALVALHGLHDVVLPEGDDPGAVKQALAKRRSVYFYFFNDVRFQFFIEGPFEKIVIEYPAQAHYVNAYADEPQEPSDGKPHNFISGPLRTPRAPGAAPSSL